ncbi:MAG: polyisoprenoid-binding protein YceI [Rhodothermales bacterium]|jgi:polyisoprenoid-binding protein YceI
MITPNRLPLTLLSSLALVFMLVGCSNPADDVTTAKTTAAVETDAAASDVAATIFVTNEASTVGFTGSKVTGSHDGGFKTFTCELAVADGKLIAAGSVVEIDMASTWSDAEKLTKHLKSADFFDTEKFPTAGFTFTSVGVGEDDMPAITGNFDFHGVTKSISFPATIEISDTAVTLKTEFSINRGDFNIKYPGKTDDLIRDEVVIRLDLAAAPK